MRTDRQALLDRAQTILDGVKAEGRSPTPEEQGKIAGLLDSIKINDFVAQVGAGLADEPGLGFGLYGALQAAGFDRTTRPSAVVPFSTFGATASFDGSYSDAARVDITSPPLGADRRFLFPALPRVGVEPDTTAVGSFRQQARTVPSPISDMIRDIDATAAKPEVGTVSELLTEQLHQIAAVESDVPNIFLESAAFRGWIDQDLNFAFASAVDYHVTAQIAAASPPLANPGADLLESILLAAEVVAAAGYSPRVLAASPETLLSLLLLKQPGTGDYVSGAMDPLLSALRRVAVTGLTQPYVLDPAALGELHISPVRLQAFEQDAGKTNQSTVRIEATGVFVVQRVGAAAAVDIGGS